MPIRPELRHHYAGPEWKAIRARIAERAGNACEKCGAPNGIFGIQCGVAHLDQNPANNADDNLAYLCRGCHLKFDARFHAAAARHTRQVRKDRARPLLAYPLAP
jgi:5-methylcytosine-specific restriction endonuclease McrA